QIQAQQSVSDHSQDDIDVIGFAKESGMACIHLLMIRQGRILGSRSFFPKIPAKTGDQEVFTSFVEQYYLNQTDAVNIPQLVIYDGQFVELSEVIAHALAQVCGRRVQFVGNARGIRARYLKLATTNAVSALASKVSHKMTMRQRVNSLQSELALPHIERMECFDISHTMGESTVASCVVFDRDGPVRSEYRRYNITGITGGDDYAAMGQVLERRYKKLVDAAKIPDVIFIDGGKGQLNRAFEIIQTCWQDWPKRPHLIGIAKGEGRKFGLETLFSVTGDSYNLAADSPGLHLVGHIRDESHDHAIAGHRAKRGKTRQKSSLEGIEGVGPKRRQALLKYMGGLQALKNASVDDLCKVPGISRALAQTIYDALKD
ncbi:MAG: excinuclease ABC subunit UvrC, partial [Vibrio sp.]